jgi:hypothetical protein
VNPGQPLKVPQYYDLGDRLSVSLGPGLLKQKLRHHRRRLSRKPLFGFRQGKAMLCGIFQTIGMTEIPTSGWMGGGREVGTTLLSKRS